MASSKAPRGLLLSGGGARAAYQAGVLLRLSELAVSSGAAMPFEILVGASAGAINTAVLASYADDFPRAIEVMTRKWRTIATSQVFDARASSIGVNAFRWFLDLALGGALESSAPRAKALVDTAPLQDLVQELLVPGAIARHLAAGILQAVAISATDYQTGNLTIFVESGRNRTLWRRYSRVARHDSLTAAHVMASCAIPILFPAIRIGRHYFGDGSIRNTAPLSPAIRLGARRVLAITVRDPVPQPQADPPRTAPQRSGGSSLKLVTASSQTPGESAPVPPPAGEEEPRESAYPSPARISGLLLDSVFLDALEIDREQMNRINRLLELLEETPLPEHAMGLQPIEFLAISPSRSLSRIALEHVHEIPKSIRYMLRGLGANSESGGAFLSYLLFEKGYCRELLDLGYADASARDEELRALLWPSSSEGSGGGRGAR